MPPLLDVYPKVSQRGSRVAGIFPPQSNFLNKEYSVMIDLKNF